MKLLQVKGKDAADFLHRLTAGTVKGVKEGQGARGLLLTGQGKMRAQFDLLHVDENRYWLAVPDACADALYSELDAKLFTEDVKLFWRDEPWSFEPGALPGAGERVFPLGHAVSGVIWPSSVPGFRGALDISALPPEFHFERIGALVPWPGLDWDESHMALESGTLPWIDRDKGCYPGQEVVEKSLNLGHPPRVLQAYEGSGALEAGARLGDGVVTSFAAHGGVTRALVRLPWAKRETEISGFRKLLSHS